MKSEQTPQSILKDQSKVAKSIKKIHFVNIENNLVAKNDNGDDCQSPKLIGQEGIYKLTYLYKPEGYYIHFRFVDLGDGISINFTKSDSSQLHQFQYNFQEFDKNQQSTMNAYLKELQRLIKKQIKRQVKNYPVLLQPIPIIPNDQSPTKQIPRIHPLAPSATSMHSEQFVGPNHPLFVGRGKRETDKWDFEKHPPGSRWDPIDPFGNEGPPRSDFIGFDEFGRPIQRAGSERPIFNRQPPFRGNFGNSFQGGFGSNNPYL